MMQRCEPVEGQPCQDQCCRYYGLCIRGALVQDYHRGPQGVLDQPEPCYDRDADD